MNPARRHPALDLLAPGATLLTATRRLARTLHAAHARQAGGADAVWETPDILPWESWLRREWDGLVAYSALGGLESPGLALDPVQERALWGEIIAAAPEADLLLQHEGTARLVCEARALQHRWRLDIPRSAPLPRDARAFIAWSEGFERRCRKNGWIEGARVPDLLGAAWRSGGLPAPARVILAGFDELTPQQRDLLDTLAATGCDVRIAPAAGSPDARVVRRPCADPEAEMRAAACWARRRVEADPHARIAIVVPDLAARRAALTRILDEVLVPGATLPGGDDPRRPWNVSLGVPLAAAPVVHTALDALRLLRGDAPLAAVGALLRSPFIDGGETEAGARARLDARLRRRGQGVPGTDGMLEAARAGGDCPSLAKALARWRRRVRALPARGAPSAWAERLLHCLEALGWPGERALDSEEYQAVEAWRELVSRLALLDAITPSIGLTTALAWIERLARERVFQPEGEAAPIEVLGVLEAAGMDFDHLWVMGLHDEVWPQAPDPNPFLPLALQRELGLPRATPARELEVARRITARLGAAAPEVCFSHPGSEGDRPLRPSALIAALPEAADGGAEEGWQPYAAALQAAGRMESVVDRAGPPLPTDEAPGGARLFELQAQCPFRAFAELRLHARAIEEPSGGPDARVRGWLLHRALERLWEALGGSEGLARLDDEGLAALAARIAGETVEEARAERPGDYPRRYAEVERARVAARLLDWVAEERRRPEPFEIEALEDRRRVRVGAVEIEVRIDRIDRLADGRRVLIDYKTGGGVDPAAWFGARPEQPQLPLYGVAVDGALEALLFACLKPGEIGYAGVSAGADFIEGRSRVRPWDASPWAGAGPWEGQRETWRTVLEGLARDFAAGAAPVDPHDYPSTCRHCDVTALCRVAESADFGVDPAQEEER